MDSMKPEQWFFNGKFQMIRPLCYLEKNEIIKFCRKLDIFEFINSCPSNKISKRESIRGMLNELYQSNDHIKGNIFKAMGQVIND